MDWKWGGATGTLRMALVKWKGLDLLGDGEEWAPSCGEPKNRLTADLNQLDPAPWQNLHRHRPPAHAQTHYSCNEPTTRPFHISTNGTATVQMQTGGAPGYGGRNEGESGLRDGPEPRPERVASTTTPQSTPRQPTTDTPDYTERSPNPYTRGAPVHPQKGEGEAYVKQRSYVRG